MDDQKTTQAATPAAATPIAKAEARAPRRPGPGGVGGTGRPGAGGRGPGGGDRRNGPGGGRGRPGGGRRPQEPKEFEQKILDLARVTRVTAGGKRMSFRASVVIGDKRGRVGLGVAKGADVQLAVDKAYRQAKRHPIKIPLVNESLPHMVRVKYGSAIVILKPAPKGTGLKCGGAVRMVLELGGVANAVSKVVNSSNKLNIASATIEAIKLLRAPKKTEAKASATEEVKV